MNIEQRIIAKAEKKLLPYRIEAERFKSEQREVYEHYFPCIQKCLEEATYWHGTGRYHYQYQGESRYESVRADALLDVLGSLVEQDGLIPHHDPWIDSGGKTVSLATVRMHSRLFARIHLYEKDTLTYELGDIRFWVILYTKLLLLWTIRNVYNCRQFIAGLFRRGSYTDLQTYASALRKPHGNRAVAFGDLITMQAVTTDIPGNYPILIGISKKNLQTVDTIPLTHAVEVRSLQPVMLQNFTHIEVPLVKIEETEKVLKEKGVELAVLPLEFVDIYVSATPLAKLAYI